MNDFEIPDPMSWEERLSSCTPSMLFKEAINIKAKYDSGDLSADFAKELLSDIDRHLHYHDFWLPERLKMGGENTMNKLTIEQIMNMPEDERIALIFRLATYSEKKLLSKDVARVITSHHSEYYLENSLAITRNL